MQEFLNFVVKFKIYISYIALSIICMSLISLGDMTQIGGFRAIIISTMGNLQDAFSWIPNPGAIKSENRALRELNLQLSLESIKMRESLNENDKLRNLLKFKEGSTSDIVTAEVVGKSTLELRNYLTLNVGTDEGIEVGMIVRTDAGLVGTIIGRTQHYSIVELISNRNVKISGKIIRTGINGIVVWQGEDNLWLNNIPSSFDVKVNDEVITSEFTNKYPKNIPIGRISEVVNDKSSLFLKIKIKPFAELSTLEQVFVVKEIPNPEQISLIRQIESKLKLLKKD